MKQNEQNKNNSNSNNFYYLIWLCGIFITTYAILVSFGTSNQSFYRETIRASVETNRIIIREDYYYYQDIRTRRTDITDTRRVEQPSSEDRGGRESSDRTPTESSTGLNIFFTSYNPEEGQTDSTPCIGAIGEDVCKMKREGYQPIALSRDLIWGTKNGYCTKDCPFTYGDVVKLESDIPQCNNLVGEVVDTMNKRFTMRGDLFFLDRSENTSCNAKVVKLSWVP